MKSIDELKTFANEAMGVGVQFDSLPAALRQFQVMDSVLSGLNGTNSQVVGLDIGSKYGHLRKLLMAKGVECLRHDIVERDDDDGLTIGDGKTIPFEDNSFDFVVISHVLAHVSDLEIFINEVRRILKKGGKAIVLQNNRFGWWKFWGYYIVGNDKKYHFRTFSVWDLHNTFNLRGLKSTLIKSVNYFYLQSKNSEIFLKFDLRHGSLIPTIFATQWIAVFENPKNGTQIPTKNQPIISNVLWALAVPHALILKSLELMVRKSAKFDVPK